MKKLLIIPVIILALISTLGVGKVFLNKAEEKEQAVLTTPKPEEKVIVAFGDSLTAGFGLKESESYPSVLQAKLNENGYRYKVINKGISGDTTAGGLRRVEEVLDQKPAIVILNLGSNDAIAQIPAAKIEENLSKIIESLNPLKIKVLLGGMKPPITFTENYSKELDQIYPNLSKKYNLPLIPFFLEGVLFNQERTLPDRSHPNAEGYKIIVENNVWPYLIKIIEK